MDVFDVEHMWWADDGQQVNLGVAEISLHVEAVALDGDDIVNDGCHCQVVNGGDKLLSALDHAHYLPAGVTIAGNSPI